MERETAQKEENASEKLVSLEAILKQDRAGVSLSREHRKSKKEGGRKREKSQPAVSTRPELRDQAVHPDVLLFPLLRPPQLQPSCVWFGPHRPVAVLQSAAGGTASVSPTTGSGG